MAELGPKARAATPAEAAAAGDFAVVTVPLKSIRDVPVEPLAGKIVIDTNNYYWERDGHIPGAGQRRGHHVRPAAGAPARSPRWPRASTTSWSPEITTDGTPAGTPNRRALATASDFPEAAELVTRLYDEFGFDTVNIGPLSESWRVERDRPAYVVRQNAAELTENLARAPRTI